MKKFSKIIAALGVVLLVGCNGNGNSSTNSNPEPSTPAASTPAPSTPAPGKPSSSTPVEKPEVTGYELHVNGAKLLDFTINEEASLQPGQEAEYMASTELAVNDVLTVLDSNGDAAMNWENVATPGAYTALAAGEHTVYLKVWNDGTTSAWLVAPEVEDTPVVPDEIIVTSFGLYADDVLVAAFEVNTGNTDDFLNAEYMTSVNLTAGVSLSIKDAEGNAVEGVWWENTASNSYVTTAEGAYTLYYKDYKDGGKTVWVEAPAGGELPDIGDIQVTTYGLYVNGELRAELTSSLSTIDGVASEYKATIELTQGDKITIKDKDGLDVANVLFENSGETDTYSVKITGKYTFYFKLYTDGRKQVWVEEPIDPNAQLITVYFDNSSTNWSEVYVYTWSGHDLGGWPGTKMQKDATTGYYYIENVLAGCSIIFNNGNGGAGNQTSDLKLPTDGSNLYNGSSWSTYNG